MGKTFIGMGGGATTTQIALRYGGGVNEFTDTSFEPGLPESPPILAVYSLSDASRHLAGLLL